MLNMRPGIYAYSLLELLCVAGEFPATALKILGDVRTMKALVKKMQTPQKVLFCGKVVPEQLRVLRASGKGDSKTMALYDEPIKKAEGYDYLCVIKDIVSGDILSVVQSERMTKELVIQTFLQAQARHNRYLSGGMLWRGRGHSQCLLTLEKRVYYTQKAKRSDRSDKFDNPRTGNKEKNI